MSILKKLQLTFLVGHELDQVLLLGVDALSLEFLGRESGQTVVEQVELDPFLVERQIQGLEVKVGHGDIFGRRRRSVGVNSTRRRRRGGWEPEGGRGGSGKGDDGLEQHLGDRMCGVALTSNSSALAISQLYMSERNVASDDCPIMRDRATLSGAELTGT